MGEGIAVTCGICGQSECYSLGVGMSYWSLENVIDRIPDKKQQDRVSEILKNFGPDFVDYEHKLFACPECETVHGRFYVVIRKGDQTLFESVFRCGKCRSRLVCADSDITRYRCGKCGSKALESATELYWD